MVDSEGDDYDYSRDDVSDDDCSDGIKMIITMEIQMKGIRRENRSGTDHIGYTTPFTTRQVI